jgi:hypothetical protein
MFVMPINSCVNDNTAANYLKRSKYSNYLTLLRMMFV